MGEHRPVASGNSGQSEAAQKDPLRLGKFIFEAPLTELENATAPELRELMARLVGTARGELDAKTGSYEALWIALENCWFGDGKLAQRMQAIADDHDLIGAMWRVCLECAHHRGDLKSARKAYHAFLRHVSSGLSLELVGETLRVRNLWNLTLQNQLPAVEVSEIMTEIILAATALRKTADAAGAIVDLAQELVGDDRGAAPTRSTSELHLWMLLGKYPSGSAPDRERGRCYGTAARSYAFAGKFDEALEGLIRARACFADGSFDARLNTIFITQTLLEEGRVTGKLREPALKAAIEVANVAKFVNPQDGIRSIIDKAGALSSMALLFRLLLWGGALGEANGRKAWVEELNKGKQSSLFDALKKGEYRSHPSELISRHAGEIAHKTEAKEAWFDLSIQLCEDSLEGTIRRSAEFSKRLRAGKAAEGEAGGIRNPGFEHR